MRDTQGSGNEGAANGVSRWTSYEIINVGSTKHGRSVFVVKCGRRSYQSAFDVVINLALVSRVRWSARVFHL